MSAINQEIGDLLRSKGLTLAVVESASGGLISQLITDVPGSSDYFKGSVTAYSIAVKVAVVGVKRETIDSYGVVSGQVAEEMAAGGRKLLGADICLADTGIAGPGGATAESPLGLFYIGLCHGGTAVSREHCFRGGREENKRSAAAAALNWLKEYLSGIQ